MKLPQALIPLEGLRSDLAHIVALLGGTSEAEVRADLADELVRIGAEYEDVLDRALYPGTEELLGRSCVGTGRAHLRSVRTLLGRVRHRTRHVKPINAHLEDPAGFEQDLSAVVLALRRQLTFEDQHLIPLLWGMDPFEARALESELGRSLEHATIHPNPPKHRAARMVVDLTERIERKLNDTATMSHPGTDRMDRAQDAGG